MPKKFEFSKGGIVANGAVFTIENKKAVKVEAISF
jgi:hypothetical protein